MSYSSSQVLKCSNNLASLFGEELETFLGESSSPFIVEGDGLTSQRKRERIRVLPNLVAHAVGYEMVVGAHNIVYVQMHLAGSTMFAWHGKRRRLQYCLCSDTSGRLYSARLA